MKWANAQCICPPHPWLFIAGYLDSPRCGQLQHSCPSTTCPVAGVVKDQLHRMASPRSQTLAVSFRALDSVVNKCHIYLSSVCVCMYSTFQVYLYICIQMCTHIFSELLETTCRHPYTSCLNFQHISLRCRLSTGHLSTPQHFLLMHSHSIMPSSNLSIALVMTFTAILLFCVDQSFLI